MANYRQPLLMMGLLFAWIVQAAPDHNHFFYQDILNEKKDYFLNRVKLNVETSQGSQASVFAVRGGNATLPCRYWHEPELSSPKTVRVKWSWVPTIGGQEMDVLVAIGSRNRSFGQFRGRVHLRQDSPGDAALLMTELGLNDMGRYRCEVIQGLEDKSSLVDLELHGVVFPYQPPHGRYHLNFSGAQQACQDQDSTLATFRQLYRSWEEGLNWCNAGWLADGTVQYPITEPRTPCGGPDLPAGVRSYGRRNRHHHLYDVFCFSSSLRGEVYYLQPPLKLNLTEAEVACQQEGADIARVGQLYAAWKFTGLDSCDAGWLADGSLRYPITRPRINCGLSGPGIRSFGFPPPQHKHGVYCYKSVTE